MVKAPQSEGMVSSKNSKFIHSAFCQGMFGCGQRNSHENMLSPNHEFDGLAGFCVDL